MADGIGNQPVVVTPAPVDGRLARFVTWAKPVLVSAVKVGVGVALTLAVNLVALLIAIPIGIAIDEIFWSIAVTELALLLACLTTGGILAIRARRSEGAGVMIGWAVGYVGLIGIVVALIVAAVVILAVAWVLLMLLWPLAALLGS